MRKFILQAAFDGQYHDLMLKTADYCARYSDCDNDFSNRKLVESLLFDYKSDQLLVKQPRTKIAEMARDVAILTLDYFVPEVSFFVNEDKFEEINVTQLYSKFITVDLPADRELHILVYMNLSKTDDISKISKLLSAFPSNLNVTLDVALLPIDSATNDKILLKNNLSALADLKRNNNDLLGNIFFWETIDERGTAHVFKEKDLVETFGKLVLAMTKGYQHVRNESVEYPITLFGMCSLQIDKFGIVENWCHKFLRNLIKPFVQNNNSLDVIDKDKVHNTLREILGKEKELFFNDNESTAVNHVADDIKSVVLYLILHSKLNPRELEYLLDCCRSFHSRNTDSELLESDGVPIPDELFADLLGDMTGDDSFVKLREIIQKINVLKENIRSQEQKIEEKKKYLSDYSYDGELSDNGFLIHGQEFHTYSFKETPLESDFEPHTSNPPSNADLRKYFTVIKNQGEQGACASFSLVSVFEYFMANETASNPNLSEAFVYYNAREKAGNTDNDSGVTLQNVIKAMSESGICVENLCPYDEKVFNKRPDDEAYADGQKRKVVNAQNVKLDIETVKSAINEGFPVVVSFRVFDSLAKNVGGFVPMPSPKERESEKKDYHAMVLCGYSDEQGYFIARNSWGKKFGDKGYCYIPYAYVRDPELTTYACAITGIDISTTRHRADSFLYNQQEKSDNIQYSILQNQLVESQFRLKNDQHLLQQLSDQYTKLLNSVVNGKCLEKIKTKFDKDVHEREGKIKNLWKDHSRWSISNQTVPNVVQGIVTVISIALIVYGICPDSNWAMIIGGSAALLLSVIVFFIRFSISKKKITEIKTKISTLEKEISQLQQNYKKKEDLQKRISRLIGEVKVISDSSKHRKSILLEIEKLLSNSYSWLINNMPEGQDQLLFPEDYQRIAADCEDEFKLWPSLFNDNNASGDIIDAFHALQRKVFDAFCHAFNLKIENVYGPETDDWRRFGLKVERLPLLAQVSLTRNEPSTPIFFSNMAQGAFRAFPVYTNNNQYLYLYLKRVDIEKNLTLFMNNES